MCGNDQISQQVQSVVESNPILFVTMEDFVRVIIADFP